MKRVVIAAWLSLLCVGCEGIVPPDPPPPTPLDPCAGLPPIVARAIPDTITVNGAANLTAEGGSGRYVYRVVSTDPVGTVQLGRCLAGATPGSESILVSDDCDNSARVSIEVTAAFRVLPVRSRVVPGTQLDFSVEGNTGPVTFSVQRMGSAGTLTGTTYVAGAVEGTDIIRAIDENTRDQVEVVVEVDADARFRPATERLALVAGSFAPLRVLDGSGVVSWSLESGAGTIEQQGGAPVYVAADGGDAVLKVTDRFLDAGALVKVRVLNELVRNDLLPQGGFSDFATLVTGDFDGDGVQDLALGRPESHLAQPQGGAVFIFKGSTSGLPDEPTWTIAGGSSTAQLGAVMAAGDLDGDGRDDLAISAPGDDITANNSGAVYLYGIGPEGPRLLRPVLTGLGAGLFGAALDIADVDGDGDNDLLVGSPNAALAGVGARGIIDIFPLQAGRPIPDLGERRIPGIDLDEDGGFRVRNNLFAGRAVIARDFNGDGLADLAIVSTNYTRMLEDAGLDVATVPAIQVHLGRAGALFETTPDLFIQPRRQGDGDECGAANGGNYWQLGFVPPATGRPPLLALTCDLADSPDLRPGDAGTQGGNRAGGVLLFDLTGYSVPAMPRVAPLVVTRLEAWARVYAPQSEARGGRFALLDIDGDAHDELVLGAWNVAAASAQEDGGTVSLANGGRLDFYSLDQGAGERLGVAVAQWQGRLSAVASRASTVAGDWSGRLDLFTPVGDPAGWSVHGVAIPARPGNQQFGVNIDVAAHPQGLVALSGVPFWHGPQASGLGGDLNAGRAWAWNVTQGTAPTLISQGAGGAHDAGAVWAVGNVNQARDVALTDFNGDGLPDAVVTAQSFAHPQSTADGGFGTAGSVSPADYAAIPPGCGAPTSGGYGAVRVFQGRTDGSFAEAFRVWGPRTIAGCVVPDGGAAAICQRTGIGAPPGNAAPALVGNFDFDGDGTDDLGVLRTGGLDIFRGRQPTDASLSKPTVACDVYYTFTSTFPTPPYAVHSVSAPAALGDLNGDGCDEVALRYLNNGGSVTRQGILIFYGFGPSCGSNQASWLRISGDTETGVAAMRLGIAMARASGVLADGRDAVAVTADLYPVEGDVQPTVLLLPVPELNALKPSSGERLVGVQGTTQLTPVPLAPPQYTLSFGRSLAGGLDVDGDLRNDLVVSAPGASLNGDGTGAVYVFKGGTVVAGRNQPAMLVLPDAAERSAFGQDVALSAPAHGQPPALGIGAPLSYRWGSANGTAFVLPLDF